MLPISPETRRAVREAVTELLPGTVAQVTRGEPRPPGPPGSQGRLVDLAADLTPDT